MGDHDLGDRRASPACTSAADEVLELRAEIRGLRAAMEHRAPIEQAKGVIMATMHCDPDTAFAVLVSQSQAENRKVRDVAVDLVASLARDRAPAEGALGS